MATEQVLSWIQNDLRLSQVVSNFETDFSSGYLLGEVLAHYGLTEATQFIKKKNKESKVNNFYLVEDALRKIKVKFDGKMIHQIMEEERGVALRLLYQIKLAAQRLQKSEEDPDELSMTNIKKGTVYKVIQKKQNEVMELSATIQPPTVGGKDVRSNKQKLQDKRIIAFEVNQKKLFDSALEAQREEMSLIQKITQEQRSLQQTKLFENQTFMKEWMQEGHQKWQLNQERRAQAIEKVKYFEDREVNIYKNKINAELNEATNEMSYGISDYEKNLQKLGIQQNISMADAVKRMEEKKGIPPGQIQNFSYAATMNKIKETKKNSDFAGKERDRRRRKMTVDQLNAQTKLDAQAQEEQLIAKLLAQTRKEQEESYVEERTLRCKNLDFNQRQAKSTQLEQQMKLNNEIAESQKRLKSKEVEAERKQQIELRHIEQKALRFQEKLKARSLHVEIASGLVDLILDLTDETFEIVQADSQHQIQKPEWRNFIDIFKSGKKVSLRNVSQAPVRTKPAQNEDNFMIGKDAQAHEVIKLFGSDKSVVNLYDYLAGISQFDIGRLRADIWSQFKSLYAGDDHDKSKFIDTKLQKNPDLSALIESLYAMIRSGNQSPDNDAQTSTLFSDLNFKILMTGSAFSGKKTVAKQLQETLGTDVVIFNINDIVKEAIDYINPKKQEEVVIDPKAKGKKPATEVVALDIFEGKNVQKYRQTAQSIKDQFLPGDQLPRKVDLADLVLDDQLLTTLLIERLRLQFEGKTLGKSQEDIKAGLAREHEILKILDDLEQQALQAAADPKAKGAKKDKSAQDPEKLQAELEDIRRFKPVGWILVDYPKTQNQIKLLEQELSGFISKVDQQKPEKLEIQETWHKLVLDDEEMPTEIQPSRPRQSGFDAILFLKTDTAECQRRGTGRKIDPNTQVVYLPGELPTDAKTLERLQDYNDEAGDMKRIKQSAEVFSKRIGSLKKWSEQFGLINDEGLCAVTLGQEVESATWNSKESVKEAVMQNVKQILSFKQQGFDAARQMIKANISVGQLAQQPEGNTASNINSKVELLKVEQQSHSHNQSNLKSRTGLFSEKGETKKMSDTVGDGKSSMGGTTNKSAARRKNQPRFEINDTQKINRWEEMLNSYFRENLASFTQLTKQRRTILERYEDTQDRFIDFICRETPYQKRINEFVDSFNRFSQEYPDLRSNPETKTELLKRVTVLSNQLWEQILERKNQAVTERENLTKEMHQGWESHEIAKLISSIGSLIQNEFEKLRTTVAMTTGWVWNEEVDLVTLCSRLDEKAVQTFRKGDHGEPESPMLDQIVSYIQSCVTQLMSEQFVAQNDEKTKQMINTERVNFNFRCNTLRVYTLTLLEEINNQTEHVSETFQSWIITSVKKENTVCQAIVSQIKKQVENDTEYMTAQVIENPKLDRIIERVDMKGAIVSKGSISGMSQFNPTNRRFDISTLRMLFSQFVKHSQEQLLEAQTFITLMMRCYQSLKMPSVFRSKSFRHIFSLVEKFAAKPLGNEAESEANAFSGENSAGPQYLNWKKTHIFFALFSTAVPTEVELEAIQLKLEKFGHQVSQKDFIQTEMWFDELESISFEQQIESQIIGSDTEEGTIDYTRVTDIKELIWLTIKRTNENGVRVADFIDVIRALSAQVQDSNQQTATFSDILDF